MNKPIKPLEELLDSVRDIEGFPIGKDEDILALSDSPYYTACPNPYIKDFVDENEKPYDKEMDDYQREPFVGDVSEGKNDPVYLAHTYHTKVPHKAIIRYIEHYTDPGDIVYDGFCGTGMTGVAAIMTKRHAIISDLSPIASFIAYNYNTNINREKFTKYAYQILDEVNEECSWMFETEHTSISENSNSKLGKINYTVWSDVFICPYCDSEVILWESEKKYDSSNGLTCLTCSAKFEKKTAKKETITFFDTSIDKNVTQPKQVPVLINYSYGKKTYKKKPNPYDFSVIEKINNVDIPYWFPSDPMMKIGAKWGDSWRAGVHQGVSHIHHFYTKRNLYFIAAILNRIEKSALKNHLKILITSVASRNLFKGNRFVINKHNPNGRINGPLSGTLYLPSLMVEQNPYKLIKYKIKQLANIFPESKNRRVIISTESSVSNRSIHSNSIDYIFTDPPFGDNIMYSELNYINEGWLKVSTNNKSEAIICNSQEKKLSEYSLLI